MEAIEEKIKKLPPDLRKEVEDFVDFLLEKTKYKKEKNRSLIGLVDCVNTVISIPLLNFRKRHLSGETENEISYRYKCIS